jgi:glycerol-3-phosphate O-acyltransferase
MPSQEAHWGSRPTTQGPSSILALLTVPLLMVGAACAAYRQVFRQDAGTAWNMAAMASETPVNPEATFKTPGLIETVIANIKLIVSEVMLRIFVKRNPDTPLHRLPQRNIVSSDADIYVMAQKFPEKYRDTFLGWYKLYKEQVVQGGATEKEVWSVFNRIVDRLILLNKQPYTFQSAHKMLQEPYDYFEFGQMYSRLLVDYNKSYLRNLEKWDEIAEKIKRGENIILTGNHQSESDAAFIPLLLEVYNRKLGEQVIYVAGDRVVSDPMVQPFSMGRNLFCVHSKKHMDDDPRMSREAKQKMNRKTLLEMSKAFKKGGNLVWIAPSGGRDRKNAAGDWVPAEFDIDAVELMRALGAKSPNPTWLYPFAMATNAIMPPPDTRAQGTLGEKRIVNFTGVALSVGEAFAASGEGWLPEGMELGTEAAKQHLTDQIFEVVNDEYDVIKNVMKGFGDGTYVVPNGKQPWKEGARSPVEL